MYAVNSFFKTNNASTEFRLNMYYENFPAVTESATSVKITAPNLPKKLNQGYYCIRSNVLDGSQFIVGSDSGQLYPVIDIVSKSNDFGDFYVGQAGETFTFYHATSANNGKSFKIRYYKDFKII